MLLVFLYGVQGIAGLRIYNDQSASQFVEIFSLGLLAYLLTYLSLRKYVPGFSWLESITETYRQPLDWWIKAISAAYFLLMIFAVASSEKIALWEAINGGTAADLAHAREALFKSRTGWEHSLIYLNAMLSSALMPYVLVVCYLEKKSYRHILLALFVATLLPSLEKALVIKAFLPLIIVAFNGYLPRRNGYVFIVLMLAVIAGTTYLSKMGQADLTQQAAQARQERELLALQQAQQRAQQQAQEAKRILQLAREARLALRKSSKAGMTKQEELEALQAELAAEQAELEAQKAELAAQQALEFQREQLALQNKAVYKYQILGTGGQSMFLLNRILWIPYITAYDWLGYFHEKMNDEYLHGRTSLAVSALTGQHQYPMEKEVFIYQFGAGGPPTAAANATFLVDAFVNFGWLGVVLFAGLVAALTRLVDWVDNPAAKVCYYFFAYQISMGGLLGVLFSNGMLIFIALALFTKPTIISNTNNVLLK